MNYLSICSGIEAFSVAVHHMPQFKPVGFSEIEKFPSQVLEHHYPSVPNFGDMTKFEEWEINESVDLICGGTPCQAFSVAGARRSLDDDRGNLSLVFCEMVKHFGPEWVIWENVPGVLSTKDNAFGCFLAGLVGEDEPFVPADGKWPKAGVVTGPERTAAWRVLDAQYFGVAQRRKRVFVLSVRGSGNFRCAEALFPQSESVSGNPPTRRKTRQETTGYALPSVAGSLDTQCGGGKLTHQSANNGHLIIEGEDLMSTLTARMFNALGARDVEEGAIRPVVCDEVAATLTSSASTRLDVTSDTYVAVNARDGAEITGTITASMGKGGPDLETKPMVCLPINTQVATRHNKLGERTAFGIGEDKDPAYTLQAAHSHAVAIATHEVAGTMLSRNTSGGFSNSIDHAAGGYMAVAYGVGEKPDVAHCLRSGASKADKHESTTYIATQMQVRRLTPTECHRLQGFPDGYCDIRPGGKDTPDGPQYKALGNSMAVNVMRWLAQRIASV